MPVKYYLYFQKSLKTLFMFNLNSLLCVFWKAPFSQHVLLKICLIKYFFVKTWSCKNTCFHRGFEFFERNSCINKIVEHGQN